MSSRDRYCSSRRRRPTSSSSPWRLWWSCLCTFRCSVRSLIRLLSSAIWTSGEPVSPSLVACAAMISFFTSVSSGTVFPRSSWSSAGPLRRPARVRLVHAAAGKVRAELPAALVGKPHEGAASLARYFGRELRYHVEAARRASHFGPPCCAAPPSRLAHLRASPPHRMLAGGGEAASRRGGLSGARHPPGRWVAGAPAGGRDALGGEIVLLA